MPEEEIEKRVKIKVEESETAPEESSANIKSEEQSSLDINVSDVAPVENNDVSKDTTASTANMPKEKIPTWVLVFAFLGGLAIGAGLIGGIFYYKQKMEPVLTEPTQTPLPTFSPETETSTEETPEASSSASPKAKADFSKYSLSILNGSGIIGEAGKVEKLVKEAGFSKTKTGNAQSYDFESTEIAVKTTVPDSVYKSLTESLSDYKIKKVEDLTSTSTYDIVITVGSTKN